MTIEEIKRRNEDAGWFFFTPSTMRFFNSRIVDQVHEGPGGVFFVSAERMELNMPERFTVRWFDPETAFVNTPGRFQEYDTADAATTKAQQLAAGIDA